MSTETTVVQKAAQAPINIDMTKGVLPANYSEVMQMAALIHNSGLAPKSLDTVQKVAVAMMMAIEVGLPVVTGIQNIAVINNRAGVWGDATIALIRASGLMEDGYPKEREEGVPFTDAWTFYCTVKRKKGPEKTGSFSWADAKRAGLDNPQLRGGGKDVYSPWTRFPKRMMQWKARQWPYRDEFGDVLRGMKTAEELYDYIDMENPKNGHWEAPQTPSPPFDYDALRKDLIENANFTAQDIDTFEEKLAAHYQKPVEAIRQEIGNDIEDFIKALSDWRDKNGTPPEKQNGAPDPIKSEIISVGKEDASDGFIRAEFINLRSAGFSTWVHKNKQRIPTFSDDIQAEIREKWGKLYGDVAYPLDDNSSPPFDPEPPTVNENPQTNGPWIECPITEMSVDVKECQTCEKDCQTYAEWLMENPQE